MAQPVKTGFESEASRVVVVVNAKDPESLKLGQYYCRARDIPQENIIAIETPNREDVSWEEFTKTIFNPLLRTLTQRNWINATETSLYDEQGRQRFAVSSHRISYMVLMRGVPMRINEEGLWAPPEIEKGKHLGIHRNEASVEAELALLTLDKMPVRALVPNPLFVGFPRPQLPPSSIVRVTRLDGPSPSDVRTMIDGALEAERTGLIGRAYIDSGGPYAQGNDWLSVAAKRLGEIGFDSDVDTAGPTFGPLARFDAPAIYLGWYTVKPDGPFKASEMRFPPGAIAAHIYSYSAVSLRNPDSWCSGLIARGAAATLGNINEPYLNYTHHLSAFFIVLANGRTFGEAVYASLPYLSWQAVAIGDPLYRPFAVSFDQQWAQREHLTPQRRAYVYCRRARTELREKNTVRALEYAEKAYRDYPSVEIGLFRAQITFEIADKAATLEALSFAEKLTVFSTSELGLVRSLAELFQKCGKPKSALVLYEKALSSGLLEPYFEIPLLEAAIAQSKHVSSSNSGAWEMRLKKLQEAETKKP